MANTRRWIRQERKEIEVAVDAATSIELGDLLWLDTDDAKPMSDRTDKGSERLNQIYGRRHFLGVAMEVHGAGQAARTDFRVGTAGIYMFDCVSATFEIGDLIGVDEASNGTALEDQTVVAVEFLYQAIGRVAVREPSAVTAVYVELFPPPALNDKVSTSSNWLYGARNEYTLPVDSGTAIAIGDLLYYDVDDAKPAASQSDQGSETSNQQLFHDVFAGIAMTAKPAGSAGNVIVAGTGVFLYPCLSTTLEVGDRISSDEHSNGTTLQNQVVAKVSASNAAIGFTAYRLNPAGTNVECDIISSVTRAGTQNIL